MKYTNVYHVNIRILLDLRSVHNSTTEIGWNCYQSWAVATSTTAGTSLVTTSPSAIAADGTASPTLYRYTITSDPSNLTVASTP